MLSVVLLFLLTAHVLMSEGKLNKPGAPLIPSTNVTTTTAPQKTSGKTQVEELQLEVKRLRRLFNKFKKKSPQRACEAVSSKVAQDITQELSGLRAQLHTSDSMTSLRSELQYGLAALRSDMENLISSVRSELSTGLNSIRSDMHGATRDLKSELTADVADMRSEVQYNLNNACSEQKEVSSTLTDFQSSISGIRSDFENKVSVARSDMETKVSAVRSEMEAGLMKVKMDVMAEVGKVRSDLQAMLSTARNEFRDSLDSARSELQTGFMAAQSGLQNAVSGIRSDLVTTSNQLYSTMADLRALIPNSVSSVRSELMAELGKVRSDLQDSVITVQSELHKHLADMMVRVQEMTTIQAHLSYNASLFHRGLIDIRSELQGAINGVKSELRNEIANLNSNVKRSVTASEMKLLEDANDAKTEAHNYSTALFNQLNDLRSEVTAKMADVKTGLESKVDHVVSQLRDAESKLRALSAISERNLNALSTNMTVFLDSVQSKVNAVQQTTRDSRGSTFVRWGRSVCPDSVEIVYKGVVGGSSYDADGAAANRLCLTLTPEAVNLTGARTYIYGAEYKFSQHHDMDVVCAVCRSPQPTTVMIPGTQSCPRGWVTQYKGHLTAGMVGHRAASEFLCLDSRPEHRPGSRELRNGALFYYVFTQCGSLPCPPYFNMYVGCVVCSK